MISQYWVGQIPDKPLSVQIKNQDGTTADLSVYTTFKFNMLGSHNEDINLSGSSLVQTRLFDGKLSLVWPTDRSLFEEPGDYIVQLEMSGTGKKDFTSTHTIRVRELGRAFR